ncbi:MAG: hypothetical protein ACFB20_05835 [Opitutales bacterium]
MSQPPDLTDHLSDWKPKKKRAGLLAREKSIAKAPAQAAEAPQPASKTEAPSKPTRPTARRLDSFLVFTAILLAAALGLQAIIFFALA